MLKATKTTLKKIEDIFKDLEYSIRYEKGSFNSGYCIVEDKKIIVVNRFFDTEGRINCLLDIMSKVTINETLLSNHNQSTYNVIQKSELLSSNTMALTI